MMNCKCFDVLKEGLKEKDRISIDVKRSAITDGLKFKTVITMYARATNQKGKTVYTPLILNYCPFCGAKIEEDKE